MILDLSHHNLDAERRPVLDQPSVVGDGFSLQTPSGALYPGRDNLVLLNLEFDAFGVGLKEAGSSTGLEWGVCILKVPAPGELPGVLATGGSLSTKTG